PRAQGDAATLPFSDAQFDGVISGFALRNFADLSAVFTEAARVLRPAGRIALLEVDVPRQRALELGHRLWFTRAVPRIGALFSDAAAYRYLPRSVDYLPDEDGITALLNEAGFAQVRKQRLLGGAVQILSATRLGPFGIRRPKAPR